MQASSGTPCEAEQRGACEGIARISGCMRRAAAADEQAADAAGRNAANAARAS